jgi:bifunctional ADP-heptose synthase (sugar kinase/adenylyltransferase)
VKGADWAEDAIVGAEFVKARGGRVERIALREGLSTTTLVRRIREGLSALDPWD